MDDLVLVVLDDLPDIEVVDASRCISPAADSARGRTRGSGVSVTGMAAKVAGEARRNAIAAVVGVVEGGSS